MATPFRYAACRFCRGTTWRSRAARVGSSPGSSQSLPYFFCMMVATSAEMVRDEFSSSRRRSAGSREST